MQTSFNGANDRLPVYPLRVFRIESASAHHVRTLSLMYGGLITHYAKGASRYCDGDTCRPDYHRLDKIWKGYASVEVYGQKEKKWFPFVLEISEGLELDFRGLYTRGQVWELWREAQTSRKSTPVKGKLLEERDPNTFPEAFDYVPVLRHLYHTQILDLAVMNPLPPRVMLGPSDGDPPEVLRPRDKAAPADQGPAYAEFQRRMQQGRKTPTEQRKEAS